MKRLIFVAALLFHFSSYAQYQVQKGRWIISHQLGGYSFNKNKYTSYEDGVPQEQSEYKYNEFNLAFTGPDWGSIDFSTEKYDDYKNSDAGIWLSPQAGYFIRDNLMIGEGAVLSYYSSKYNYETNESGKSHGWTLGIGPMMKYFFGKNVKRKPFAGFESHFEYGQSKEKDYYHDNLSEQKEKDTRFIVTPYAGYAWFLGKRWTVDGRLQYTYLTGTEERTRWEYENGVLGSNYPETTKGKVKHNSFGISFGVSYTF